MPDLTLPYGFSNSPTSTLPCTSIHAIRVFLGFIVLNHLPSGVIWGVVILKDNISTQSKGAEMGSG